MMRNRWGVEIKKGYHAWFTWGNQRVPLDGEIVQIDRSSDFAKAYGPQVTIKVGYHHYSVGADEIAQVLPPMRVGRGGVVRANPADIHIDINSHNAKGRNVRAKNPTDRVEWNIWQHAGWWFAQNMESGDVLQAKTKAALMSKINEWEREDNPLSRVKVNSRSMATGKPPSARLKRRRKATEAMPIPGIYANPLTRVRIASDSQRSRTNAAGRRTKSPSRRLMKRRAYTDMMPQGFYANPAARSTDRYAVQRQKGSRWDTLELFDVREFALIFAKAYAKAHPSATIRVWDYEK